MDNFKVTHISRMLAELSQPETDRLTNEINRLIQKNAELGGNPDGFLFGGGTYAVAQASKEDVLPEIHSRLQPEAYVLQLAVQQLNDQLQKLTAILKTFHSKFPQDQALRNALPDAYADLSPVLSVLPRTRSPEETLRSHPSFFGGKALYEKLLEIHGQFVMNRILD